MASYLTLFSPPYHLTRSPLLPLAPYASPITHRAGCPRASQSKAPLPLRRSANYPPSLWSDGYIQSLNIDFMQEEEHDNKIKKLKNDVRRLIGEEKEMVKQLELVDTLRQLGVAYHFEEEIMDVMSNISASLEDINMAIEEDLYTIALLFRLLREHGVNVSQDAFKIFKDGRGSFKADLRRDTRGLLSLYQASYLSMEGDETMEDAWDFATKYLKLYLTGDSLDSCLREHVAYALELPLNWRMQRLHTRWFIAIYKREKNMNPILLELAKLDFNLVQNTYKRELKNLSRWWANLDLLEDKLSFVRDRLVENYLWAVGFAFEPKFSRYREALTKAICFITTIDDIYDVYGSLDELKLFTNVVERWEVSAMEQLPEYMKKCFLALFNTVNDTAYKVLKEKGVDITPYLKKAWTDLCKAYLVEAKWYHNGYTPTLKEYLENAWISISGHLPLTLAYLHVEDLSTEALGRFQGYPHIIRWSCMISRLSDDLGTSTAELERGDVPKSIQCYMHERGVSEDVARKHISELIRAYWKKLNGDATASSPFGRSFKGVAKNIPRVAQCIYQHGDGYGEQADRETKDRIISLLIEPVL